MLYFNRIAWSFGQWYEMVVVPCAFRQETHAPWKSFLNPSTNSICGRSVAAMLRQLSVIIVTNVCFKIVQSLPIRLLGMNVCVCMYVCLCFAVIWWIVRLGLAAPGFLYGPWPH